MLNMFRPVEELWKCRLLIKNSEDKILICKKDGVWESLGGEVMFTETPITASGRIVRDVAGVGMYDMNYMFNIPIEHGTEFVFSSKRTNGDIVTLDGYDDFKWEESCYIVNYELNDTFRTIINMYNKRISTF